MELAAKKNHLPFFTAKARLKSRYGITMPDDEFIEKGYYIWREIGNIATDLRPFAVTVPQDLIIYLPKDCEFVKKVTTGALTDSNGNSGTIGYNSSGREMETRPTTGMLSSALESRQTSLHAEGESVNYVLGDGCIQLTSADLYGRVVNVLYEAISVDSDGLPLLNDKEVEAIVANLAMQQAEIDMFRRIQGSDKLVAMLRPEAARLMVAAKSPEKISDEAIDRILDIKTSWDRKTYGNRFNFGV